MAKEPKPKSKTVVEEILKFLKKENLDDGVYVNNLEDALTAAIEWIDAVSSDLGPKANIERRILAILRRE